MNIRNFSKNIENYTENFNKNNNKYKLSNIGVGGNSFVFSVESKNGKLKDIVIKAVIHDCLDQMYKEIDPDFKRFGKCNMRKHLIENDLDTYKVIEEYFDAKHIIKPRVLKQKISLSKENVLDIIDNDDISFDDKQKLIEKINSENIEQLDVDAMLIIKPLAKEKINNEFVNFGVYAGDFREKVVSFKEVKDLYDEKFNILMDKIKLFGNNSEEVIKEFFENCIRYSEETDVKLDFSPENIIFFKNKEGDLDYHLLDPVMPAGCGLYSESVSKFEKMNDDDKMDHRSCSLYVYPFIISKMKEYLAQ